MFICLNHSTKDFRDILKLHHLHSPLKDEPLNNIKNLPISTENYKVTLQLLKVRYNQKLIISEQHIKNMLNMNTIDREFVKNITTFINTITSSDNSLETMNLPLSSSLHNY